MNWGLPVISSLVTNTWMVTILIDINALSHNFSLFCISFFGFLSLFSPFYYFSSHSTLCRLCKMILMLPLLMYLLIIVSPCSFSPFSFYSPFFIPILKNIRGWDVELLFMLFGSDKKSKNFLLRFCRGKRNFIVMSLISLFVPLFPSLFLLLLVDI